MLVRQLIAELESCDPDCEVRLAIQPSWPFEHSIRSVVEVDLDDQRVVYIGEGRQLGYLPSEAKEVWS
jgi:hypothetical protein